MIKQFVQWISYGIFAFVVGSIGFSQVFAADFMSDFANPLLQKGGYGDERAYNFNIKQDDRIIDNIKKLFYPDESGEAGTIRVFLRTIAVAVFFALLVWAGFQFILNADNPDAVNKAKMNLLYILLGATIFFLSRWILAKLLNIGTIEGLYGESTNTAINKSNNLIIVILSFLKGAAFFVAICLLVWHGFEMIMAVGEEAKIKSARTGILHIVLALIFIKIIDYLYYIALSSDFKTKSVEFIVKASKFLTYIIGGAFVLALLYAGYLMLTSSGEDENGKKGVNIIKSVFVVGVLILLFMLIIHQIFQDVYS